MRDIGSLLPQLLENANLKNSNWREQMKSAILSLLRERFRLHSGASNASHETDIVVERANLAGSSEMGSPERLPITNSPGTVTSGHYTTMMEENQGISDEIDPFLVEFVPADYVFGGMFEAGERL
jgi:hypothetical protein